MSAGGKGRKIFLPLGDVQKKLAEQHMKAGVTLSQMKKGFTQTNNLQMRQA
jgi:hypothetical protein